MATTNDNPTPDMNDPNWRKLTFAQREGYAPLPEALQVGVLTSRFRNRVWRVVGEAYHDPAFDTNTYGRGFWNQLFEDYQVEVQEVLYDEIDWANDPARVWLRTSLVNEALPVPLNVLEFILRCPDTPEYLADEIEACFKFAPYIVDRSSDPVCIIPVSSEENRAANKQSLGRINESDLTGAKAHLRAAAFALNSGDFTGCAHESMSAVESAVQKITSGKSKKFATALALLENEGVNMHRALQQALKCFYGYASDEPGIRHGGKDPADVGLPEVLLVYSACVAFVDYLLAKKG